MAFTDDEKDLFTSLGVTFSADGETLIPPADPPEGDPPAQDPPPITEIPAGDDPTPTDPPKPDDVPPAPVVPPVPDKSGQAFAAMRTENSQLKKTVEGLANLLGITDTKDTTALTEAVKSKLLEAQSKKDNIPVEYLKKIDHLESIETQFTQEQLRTNATLGFQRVIDRYKLDQPGLNAFVDELTAEGINPLAQPVDLVAEYQSRHFDDLIKAAEDKGRLEEAQRAAKAGEHSSTPNPQQGGKPEGQDKITSISSLDSFLDKK